VRPVPILSAWRDKRVTQWLHRELGGRVVSSRALRGGLSSRVELVRVESPNGALRSVVLRRVPPDELNEPQREIANESAILQLLAGRAKSPELLAADVIGEFCGVPATVQSRLPGSIRFPPSDRTAIHSWVDQLASMVTAVAEITLTAQQRVALTRRSGPFRPWFGVEPGPPPNWTDDPGRWEQVHVALLSALPEHGADRLVHRDLHPGNALFARSRWSGTVDWVHATVGPVEVDVSRCRVQIAALAGTKAADRFLARCLPLLGGSYDFRWDALVALELAPWVDDIASLFRSLGAPVTTVGLAELLDSFVLAA
jgi:aminoglycoside phosphotransferase (APT) family kinase protein